MNNLYKYRLLAIVKDRGNMFWTLAFPLLMATLFYFAFGAIITSTEAFHSIPVAVVQGAEEDAYITEMMDVLSDGDDALLDVTYTGEADARRLLEDETILGIYEFSGTPALVVKSEGLGQSILRNVLDSYLQISSTAQSIAMTDPAAVADAVAQLADPAVTINSISLADGDFNYMRENFYSLIAMTCLFGSFFGLSGACNMQADLSALGARRSITPTPKSKAILSDILASVTVMFVIVALLLLYMRFPLGIDFGRSPWAIILTSLCGVFVGIMFGMFIGLVTRGSRSKKDGILVGSTLLMCFLSGMMFYGMRTVIERNVPFLNRINPAALIVDSFYSLDTYGAGGRYMMDTVLLLVIGSLLCLGSVLILRRKQYASI